MLRAFGRVFASRPGRVTQAAHANRTALGLAVASPLLAAAEVPAQVTHAGKTALGPSAASSTPAAVDVPAQAPRYARTALGASPAYPHPAAADASAHETHAKEAAEKPSASNHPPTTAAIRLSKTSMLQTSVT